MKPGCLSECVDAFDQFGHQAGSRLWGVESTPRDFGAEQVDENDSGFFGVDIHHGRVAVALVDTEFDVALRFVFRRMSIAALDSVFFEQLFYDGGCRNFAECQCFAELGLA